MTIPHITTQRSFIRGCYLVCGCCGDGFKTWDGYIDQDQDKGFGICRSCQSDAEDREQDAFLHACNLILSGLKKKENRDQFLRMSKEQKYYIIHKMFDRGILKWQIGK